MVEYSVIGKRLPRIDAVAKATGAARYAGDMTLPRMLYGKILRSPHAHARIVHIDTTKAEALCGVKAVITGKDTLGVKYGLFPDEPAIAIDKVRFVGEGLAAVAAVDEEMAEEAAERIRVEYEELPAVFDVEEAMKPDAPLVHDNTPNISARRAFVYGDVEQGFKESDYVREDTFRTQAQAHCPLETHAALASHESNGRLTVWAATQSPYDLSLHLAKTLGVPLGDVRVIMPPVGGGFGGKREMFDLHFCAALLSKKAGRPVRICYSLEEQFTAGRYRHPVIVTMKTGVKKNGTLVAKECVAIFDGGAYNSNGPAIAGAAGSQMGSVYKVDQVKYTAYHVYTNKPVSGAFRGYGLLQVRFADEMQMDMIAQDLGIDPVQLRIKNAIGPNEIAPCGWKITSCGLRECIQKAAEGADWDRKRGERSKPEGIGMGCNNYVCGSSLYGPDSSGALIKAHEDGTVSLLTSVSDIGQGAGTTMAQIAAEELGIALEDIRISTPDTETTPTDMGTYASRVTFVAGNAVKKAAGDAKRQVLEIAAQMLEARVEDLVARDRRVYVKGSPDRGVAFSEVIKLALVKRGVHILGRGSYFAETEERDPQTGRGSTSPTFSFGAHVTQVEVDEETGKVYVRDATAAHDCGLAINPMALEGQFEGASLCALGMTLMENRIMDGGHILNPSFEGYKVATALEAPRVRSFVVETIDPGGPFGAKGVSEGAQVPVAPSIANAIFQATGTWFKELPITPEKVLAALEAKKGRVG